MLGLRVKKFSIQHAALCRPPKDIVGKADEAVVKDAALSQTSDGARHAASSLTVQPRLRTVVFIGIKNRLSRS